MNTKLFSPKIKTEYEYEYEYEYGSKIKNKYKYKYICFKKDKNQIRIYSVHK